MVPSGSLDDTLHFVADDMLFMIWMYDLPTWQLALLIVSAFVIISLVGLFFTHRRLHRTAIGDLIDNGTVGWFFSSVSLLYGLLLGLLTAATWGSFSQAGGIASQEAASITVLYRDLGGYPKSQQIELRSTLRQYTKSIVNQSWPAQRRGQIYDGETGVLLKLQDSLLTIEPQSDGQRILHTEAIRVFNSIVELRRQRMESIRGSVPDVLWSVVLLGAFLTIIFSYFFVIKDFTFHALLTGLLAAMIGLLVFLLVVLDHPYWGEVSVEPTAYQLVLDQVMKP